MSSSEIIPLTPESAEAVFSQLLENIDETTRKQLQHAETAANSEPNRLDLTFPASYSFLKSQCERPEVLGNLQKAVEKIVGQQTRVAFKLSEDRQAKPQASPIVTQRQQLTLDDADDFVRKAADLFGGRLVKVENIGKVAD